ncbi:MAG: DUF1592 domain-containing protein [Pirellulaceae bacterium]|nr:DUF1592 domain-containing protein [Pirellulaceae bacterium]
MSTEINPAVRRLIIDFGFVAVALLSCTGGPVARGAEPSSEFARNYVAQIYPLLTQYCLDCHSGDAPVGGLDIASLDPVRAASQDRHAWKKIFVQLDNNVMPPHDAEPLSSVERDVLLDWIRNHALTVPCSGPAFPGRPTLVRLNRDQYNRTIQDLIGIDYQPADNFPSDDIGYGFDNIGDVLSLSPVLMERYLEAAEEIVRRAIALPPSEAEPLVALPGRFFSSVDTLRHDVNLAVSATYLIRIEAYGDQAGDQPPNMLLSIAGQEAQAFSVSAVESQPEQYEMLAELTAGPQEIAIQFTNDYYRPDDPDPAKRGDRNLKVNSLSILGPLLIDGKPLPRSHRRLLSHQPENPEDPQSLIAAAEASLTALLPRALRRPSSQAELQRYVNLAKLAIDDGLSYSRAMQVAISGVLVSPSFLFRVETESMPNGEVERELTDYELASRLSYFLWSSQPDDALYRLAANNQLHHADQLAAQVDRLLDDPRSSALVQNFASQWLQLRKLDAMNFDSQRFPQFSSTLRSAMRRETELLFATVLNENRSIMDLLTADFTHVNELLAAHYGLEVDGKAGFERVSLAGTGRGGLLGHASILALTSNPTRTSPVNRGLWILDNLLDAPPPPPPPNVPELEAATAEGQPPTTLRAQMELHRSKPQCAACHQVMDELGFGLENFDAIGKWRDTVGDVPVDSSGRLPDGRQFNGPNELRQILLERQDEFRRCLAAKLLTYAIGRGLEYFDECTLNEICAATAASGNSLRAMIQAITASRPFRWRAATAMPE